MNNKSDKPCPFCNGEATRIEAHQRDDGRYYPAMCGCSECGIWRRGDSNYGHGGFATEFDFKVSMEQAVAKWNTRTTEQAITDECEMKLTFLGWKCSKCGKVGMVFGDGGKGREMPKFCPDCGRKAANTIESLRDRLQDTTIESGTCEWVLEHRGKMYDKWRCSECGYLLVESRCDPGYTDFEQNICPSCGRKVVER